MIQKRKKRSDRNHVIYSIALGSREYIGMTHVENGRVGPSVQRRWRKHVRRALTEGKTWKLCVAIRKYGEDAFDISVIQVVRGKETAHQVERELIRTRKPKLNSDVR